VVTDPSWRAVRAVDALITLLPTARPLTQRSRVRFHLGTAEVLTRVTPAESEIGPGETGMARLRLERDVVCRWGDRAVIRAYSPVTTVGGCVVVDPWPPARPRRPAADPDRYALSPLKRVMAFVRLAGPGGVRLEALPVRLGVPPADVDRLVTALAGAGVNRVGNRLVAEETVRQAAATILADLRQHHSEYPLRYGLAVEALRKRLHPPDLADHALAQLEAAGAVVLSQGVARVATFTPQLSGAHRDQGTAVRRAIADAGLHGLTVEGLSDVLPPEDAAEVLAYLANEGAVARVGANRYYDRNVLHAAARDVVAEITRVGEATPASLRERLGVTRKYLIPLLEWLDAQGVTARVGDVRRLGPHAHLLR
jgi:selenocysteine-specific elongation factor